MSGGRVPSETTRGNGPGGDPSSHVATFAALRAIVDGISKTFGASCEVVLHDFADPERSIIAIAGDVTHRNVGGSVSQIGLSLVAQGDTARDQIGYVTQTRDGKVLKSSTLLLRDEDGHVFGALCINLDVTAFRVFVRRLHELAGPALAMPSAVHFSDEMNEVLRAVIEEEEAALGHALDRSRKADRLQLVARLRRRGAFAVQRAVPFVADYLDVSRATIYAYLEELKGPGSDTPAATVTDETRGRGRVQG